MCVFVVKFVQVLGFLHVIKQKCDFPFSRSLSDPPQWGTEPRLLLRTVQKEKSSITGEGKKSQISSLSCSADKGETQLGGKGYYDKLPSLLEALLCPVLLLSTDNVLCTVWVTNKGCPTLESSQSNGDIKLEPTVLQERDTRIFLIILFSIYRKQTFPSKMDFLPSYHWMARKTNFKCPHF